jgi:hypothetical protein
MHQHSSVHPSYPHQASTRTHKPAIHTYLSSLLSRTYLSSVLLQPPSFFCVGNDGAPHRPTPISLRICGSLKLDISPTLLNAVLSIFLFVPHFWFLRPSPRSFVLRLLYILYNVYLLWTYDTTHILPPLCLCPCPSLSIRFLDAAFVIPFSCGNRSVLLCERSFRGHLTSLWDLRYIVWPFLITPPGSINTFHSHLSGPPFHFARGRCILSCCERSHVSVRTSVHLSQPFVHLDNVPESPVGLVFDVE